MGGWRIATVTVEELLVPFRENNFYEAGWLSNTQYRAYEDITSRLPRGDFTLAIDGAAGLDGIEIAPNSTFTFTVDYAGAIGDTTPPPAPTVLACGAASPDTLSARWSASDPESAITRFQYAIGTTSSGIDVVGWNDTQETSFTRTDLSLTAGQTYYISVKARNEGGIWSEAGVSAGVAAGSGSCPSAGLSANPQSGNAPLNVQFTDVSTGAVTSWLWDFGDDATITVQNPSHTYATAGIYTVSLTVSGPGGSDSISRPNLIQVIVSEEKFKLFLPVTMH